MTLDCVSSGAGAKERSSPPQAQLRVSHVATFALKVEKSIRWAPRQLGHAGPAPALRVYAQAMLDEETDLSFAEFRLHAGRDSNPLPSGSKNQDEMNISF